MMLRAWMRSWFQQLNRTKPLRQPFRSTKLGTELLEDRLLLSGYYYDFGTSSSPVALGYTGVPVVAYSSTLGYGWSNTSRITAVDTGVGSALTRDFHAGADGTFLVNLANGTYLVQPLLGDATAIHDNVNLYLNGTLAGSNLMTRVGQFIQPAYKVQVSTGQLSLRLVDTGGVTPTWALDALVIRLYSAPTANAGTSQTGNEGSLISFSGTATGTGALSYNWNFGDGTTSTGSLTPTHTYADDGTYTATLTVTDLVGGSSSSSVTVTLANVPPRPGPLGPYTGVAGTPIDFVVLAKDPSSVDTAAGFTYAWNFGDGVTAIGATPTHAYAAAGAYIVTVTATDEDGASRSASTTATVNPAGSTGTPTEYQYLSTNLIAHAVYGHLTWGEMASDGAYNVNAKWEQGTSSTWYIEEQRYGEDLIISGMITNNTSAVTAGFTMFNWGFAHQAADGSFAGTGDPFHSTALFVEAVAHTCLVIKESPYAAVYASQVATYSQDLYKAALWMISPTIWSNGLNNDSPYTHRRYLDADALALTSLLVGGDANLMADARYEIQDGLSLQWSNGVNPEMGGYDSSYQTVGITFAELWVTYLGTDSLTPSVSTMINKGLAWEETMILSTGQVSIAGDTRTGVETSRSGVVKGVDWKKVEWAFAYWAQMTGNMEWQADGQKVAQYYYIYY
jgi:PKD repeat protein